MTEVIRGEGALAELLSGLPAEDCVILGGEKSFGASGASEMAAPLLGAGARHFTVHGPLPTGAEVDRLVHAMGVSVPAVIVGVGGGLVLDTAKLVSLSVATGQSSEELVKKGVVNSHRRPAVILAPTTAGSGAERTPFAVVYMDGVKYSVDDARLKPSLAVLDATLVRSAPRPVAAASALDAIAHCVESMWACRSTTESRELAANSLSRLVANVERAVLEDDESARREILYAASDAGEAISHTRTTAAHALSYHLTSRYGVAHGHAVALTLGHVAAFNEQVDESSLSDPRGVAHVRSVLGEICETFGVSDAMHLAGRLRDLIQSFGLPADVDAAIATPIDRRLWVSEVNVERLANNPRMLDQDDLLDLVSRS